IGIIRPPFVVNQKRRFKVLRRGRQVRQNLWAYFCGRRLTSWAIRDVFSLICQRLSTRRKSNEIEGKFGIRTSFRNSPAVHVTHLVIPNDAKWLAFIFTRVVYPAIESRRDYHFFICQHLWWLRTCRPPKHLRFDGVEFGKGACSPLFSF
ncbi:hypothetical protein D046_0733B, partial [Vibrio parahaemolyticus V-223/04]